MKKKGWRIEVDSREDGVYIEVLKGEKIAGSLYTGIEETPKGVKYCSVSSIWVEKPELQKEFMALHKGLKIGEAIALRLSQELRKKGIKYVKGCTKGTVKGIAFFERMREAGFLRKNHEGFNEITRVPGKRTGTAKGLRQAEERLEKKKEDPACQEKNI